MSIFVHQPIKLILIIRTKGKDTRKWSNDSTSAISRWYPRHIHDLTHIDQPGSVAMSWSEVRCHRTREIWSFSSRSLLPLHKSVQNQLDIGGWGWIAFCLQLQDVDLAQEITGLGEVCSFRSMELANKEHHKESRKKFIS